VFLREGVGLEMLVIGGGELVDGFTESTQTGRGEGLRDHVTGQDVDIVPSEGGES